MERETTGRRRIRDGAVPVADLLRRQPPLLPESRPELGLADELLLVPPEESDEGSSPLAVRITMCALGALLMCGSAAAASVIIAHPPSAAPLPAAPAAPIHGLQALRPDLLRGAHWPFDSNGGYAAVQAEHANEADHALSRPAPPMSKPDGANPAAGSTGSAIRLVHDFYELLGRDPAQATTLISPAMLGDGRGDLVRAWEEFTSVSPRYVEAQPDGSVLAEVVTEHADGSRLMLRQLFTVNLGSQPGIVDAELVAARHTAPPGSGPR